MEARKERVMSRALSQPSLPTNLPTACAATPFCQSPAEEPEAGILASWSPSQSPHDSLSAAVFLWPSDRPSSGSGRSLLSQLSRGCRRWGPLLPASHPLDSEPPRKRSLRPYLFSGAWRNKGARWQSPFFCVLQIREAARAQDFAQ